MPIVYPTGLREFYDEFADVLSTISASTTDRLLLSGDRNSPGVDAWFLSDDLADIIYTLGLQQHVVAPTRQNHLLDVLAVDPQLTVCDTRADDARLISDHRLVLGELAPLRQCVRRPLKAVTKFQSEDAIDASVSAVV
jgi:hypothetical protein